MAKKSANPADAHRKAQRAKEIKRNKEDRKKVRETITLKKDTGGLEAEVRRLTDAERKGSLTATEKDKLVALRSEVDRVKKTKEDYLEKHPEHRKFVYPNEEARLKAEQEKEDQEEGSSTGGGRGGPLYGKDGRLRNPERSLYYDPILNPYGAPPPGMPYRERPRTPEPLPAALQGPDEELSESEDDEDSDEDSDDELVMPEGPPPSKTVADEESSEDDSDDIIFPDGPPPPKPVVNPPLPPGPPPGHPYPSFPPPGFDPSIPPPGFNPNFRPQHHQQQFMGRPPMHNNQQHVPYNQQRGGPPNQPPPPNFFPNNNGPHGPQQPFRPFNPNQFPRGFRPPPQTAQDPLSNVPHQTYQGHQHARRNAPPPPGSLPPNPNLSALPVRPGSGSISSGPTPPAGPAKAASISAGPQLRDFRKESAAFVPTSVKRKAKPAPAAPPKGGIDAAPGSSSAPTEETRVVHEVGEVVPKKQKVEPVAKPSALMGSLMGVLGKAGLTVPGAAAGGGEKEKKKEDKDGYGGFLEGLGGL